MWLIPTMSNKEHHIDDIFQLYKLIIETANEGIWLVDGNNDTTYVNDKMALMLGYRVEEIIGKSIFDFMDDEGVRITLRNTLISRMGNSKGLRFKLISSSGETIWTQTNISTIVQDDEYKGALAMVTNITVQKLEAEKREEDRRHYISLFEDSPVPIWDEDFSEIKKYIERLRKERGVEDFKKYFEDNPLEIMRCSDMLVVNNVNKAVVELNEAPSKDYLLENFKILVDRRSAEYAIIQLVAIANGDRVCEFDAELRTFTGKKRHVHIKWAVVKGYEHNYKHVYLSTTDLTERIIAENNLLRTSNREKELLLKEIHHRVKNNLQIIASLLKLQSFTARDPEIESMFELSLHRINSMALVHELLYQSDNFARIDFNKYIEKLIFPLVDSMTDKERHIKLNLEVEQTRLNINTAIPLGLLINEIVTNSLKHAFKSKESGTIYMKLMHLDYPQFELKIGDDGVGYSNEFKIESSESLGLQLIHSLSEQLMGTIRRETKKNGTHYVVNFQELKQEQQENI